MHWRIYASLHKRLQNPSFICTEGKMLHFIHSKHNGTQQPNVTNFCHCLAHNVFS